MRKPMIGVIPLYDTEKSSYWMLPGYMNGLMEAGGVPVILPLTSDKELLTQLANQYDGFLFTGGQDVAPSLYGEAPLSCCGEACCLRDEMEGILFPLLLQMDKPVLGICRGLQFINVILGGTLFQDLTAQRPSDLEHHQSPPYDTPVHEVEIAENTPLYDLLNKKTLFVNSYHHQAVKKLSPKLQAMAYSADGLVEAAYVPEKKYIWAVQWHPEFSYSSDSSSKRLLESFVSKAKS